MFDINPLDVLKCRRANNLCAHFTKATLPDSAIYDENIIDWVQIKLKGRFFVLRNPTVDSDGKFKSSLTIGFEDPKELTYFMLACPHLRRN